MTVLYGCPLCSANLTHTTSGWSCPIHGTWQIAPWSPPSSATVPGPAPTFARFRGPQICHHCNGTGKEPKQ